MQDILTTLSQLRRPRMLMKAARIGADDYRRSVHLPRLLGYGAMPRHSEALLKLVDIEDTLNDQRLSEDANYNMLRHIEVLIAIVSEARTLRATLSAAA